MFELSWNFEFQRNSNLNVYQNRGLKEQGEPELKKAGRSKWEANQKDSHISDIGSEKKNIETHAYTVEKTKRETRDKKRLVRLSLATFECPENRGIV